MEDYTGISSKYNYQNDLDICTLLAHASGAPVKLTVDIESSLVYNLYMTEILLSKNKRLKHPRNAIRGERVEAYGNLTECKVSLKADRWVIGHAQRIFLRDVEFTVNENNRQFVIQRHKRVPHAFAVGNVEYANSEFRLLDFEEEIRYNPFRAGHFTKPDGSAIWRANSCLVIADYKEDGSHLIYIVTNPKIEVMI